MATTYKQNNFGSGSRAASRRTTTQQVCSGIGIVFIVIGLAGILMPGLMGMHLSLTLDLIHLVSGALALWVGNSAFPKRAFYYCLAFGSVYGLLGLAGFIIGSPGYPGVGHMEADQNLLRVIPNVLELGTIDHIFHVMLSAVLLFTVYAWREKANATGRYTVNEQARTDVDFNPERGSNVDHRNMRVREKDGSEVNIYDAELGNIDMKREVDQKRRDEFERRI